MSAVILDPRTGKPRSDGDAFDPDKLTLITNIPTLQEWERSGHERRPGVGIDAHDAAVLGRLPKSVRQNLELAYRERTAGYGLKGGARVNGDTQAWAGLIDPQDVMVADQTAVVGTTEALLFPFHFTLIPGMWFSIGSIVKLTVAGKITSAASSPGNLTLTHRFGTTTGGTSIAASAALALQTSQTNISWLVEIYIVCRSKGNATTQGSLLAIGSFQAGTGTTLFTTGPIASIPASAPAAVSVDTTSVNALLLDATLGSASDSMTTQLVAPLALD